MKKRLAALLCLAAAAAILLVPWAAQAAGPYDGVYLVGVNDTVLLGLISEDRMPVRRNGVIYAPYTVLDNKELELRYALNKTSGTFTVYNRKRTLIFQMSGSGSADKEGNQYTTGIITRNGVVYIPLRFVSSFFGLTYSFYNLVLPDGAVPIARVCTSGATMGDQQFGASAALLVASPLAQYLASQVTPTPSPSTARPTAGSPSPSPSAPPQPVDLSLAVACTDGSGFQTVLDALGRHRLSALFLFSPDDLVRRDDDVRAAAAAGHQIGLLLPPEDPQAAFDRGNELLRHILRTDATQVAFLQGGAVPGDWWLWEGNVAPRGRSASAQARNLLDDVADRATALVTLNDSLVTAQALQRNAATWSARPYTLRIPTEAS